MQLGPKTYQYTQIRLRIWGFGVKGLGFRVKCLGFRVWGVGLGEDMILVFHAGPRLQIWTLHLATQTLNLKP